MSKDLNMSMLLDFYGQLLTDKQTDALDLYYNQDLSLSEIAEHLDITRQGVRDNIKRGESQLSDFEEQLGLAKKFNIISKKCEQMNQSINEIIKTEASADTLKLLENIKSDLDDIVELL